MTSKRDSIYSARVKRIKAKHAKLEDLILECLEDRSFVQARDIHDVVMSKVPDAASRHVMRMIYKIMHVDMKWLPDEPKEDLILL